MLMYYALPYTLKFLGARMSDFKICQKQNHLLRGVCNSDDTTALSTW